MRAERAVDKVILLTPPGTAAIAVVRIAGPGVGAFLSSHFSKAVQPNRCLHGKLSDRDRVIDDPVVVLHGDRADINLHGGEWVVRECISLAGRAGFTVVESDPALLDASTPIEREMLEALPDARTEQAIRMLLDQPRRWTDFLQEAQSSGMHDVQSQVREILDDRSLWWMLHPPKIAIVGIPNVGKSSLANQLFGAQRSITADVPGTTRDWVGDWANINGLPIQLLDTPGMRPTCDPIEHAAIQQSRPEIESADLVLLVLDPTQPLEDGQDSLRSKYPHAMPVINKIDLPARWDPSSTDAVRTVATRGEGIDDLLNGIRSRFVSDQSDRPGWWTSRQREILARASDDPNVLRELGISKSTA